MLGNKNKEIFINALSSVLQVLITGIVYFYLYKYILNYLGSEQLGIWSLVLSNSSIVNLANFGITAGLIKFIAEYKAKNRQNELYKLVGTSFISIFFFFLLLVFIIYIIALSILSLIVENKDIALVESILPLSLLSLFLNGLAGIFFSVLDGMQKNYKKNIVFIAAILILLFFTVKFTPTYGLLGVAYAQIIQSGFCLIASFLFSIKYFYVPKTNLLTWQKATFKEIISYGLKFQLITLSQMLYEPITKILLGMFGGLSVVAYYEMASRLITQLRAVVINANQVMIPVITEASISVKQSVKKIYSNSLQLIIIFSIPMFFTIIIFSPIISNIWIGKIEYSFIFFTIILSIANLFNIFSGPAYFGFLGEGNINPLIKVHSLIAFLNIILGIILGYFFNEYGIALAWGLSLSIPSILTNRLYNKNLQVNGLKVFNKSKLFITTSIIFLTIYILFLIFCLPYLSYADLIKYLILQYFIYATIYLYLLFNFDLIKTHLTPLKFIYKNK